MFKDTIHRSFVEAQLREDRAHDDVTARLLGEKGERPCRAVVRTREEGVFSGEAIYSVFKEIYAGQVEFRECLPEGQRIAAGDTLVTFDGPFGTCLSLERTLLNFLTHACGVASLTRDFVEAVAPHPVKILATRKTLPGLRELQLAAVKAGGGYVHRRSLSDGVLIKDNHLSAASATELISRAKATRSPLHGIEIEVQSLDLLAEVLEQKPDVIMLDNLGVESVKKALKLIGNQCRVEVSGGIHLGNVRDFAGLGIDYISVGALTHSAPHLNLTLDLEPRQA